MKNIFLFILIIFNSILFSQQGIVYHLTIENEIDLGLIPYVKRGINEAEKKSADALIIEINTFGGRVDAATQIKDLILDSRVPTIAFVNKRAISAGSLITLSAKTVVMTPSSSIGATTVVDQTGQKQAEKYQSYMRSEMRATAEANGRPTNIAEGMVDERIVVEGLVDSTKLITLTAQEAVHYGIADTILSTVRQVLEYQNLSEAKVIKVQPNVGEDVVRFLNNPVIISLLLMVGMVGMFIEIKTPGWGVAGTLSLIAFFLFFGAGIILEIVSLLDVILFIGGIILFAIEIFIIPGFGIFGVVGIILIVSSLFLGLLPDFNFITPDLIRIAIWQMAGAVLSAIFVSFLLLKYLPKTRIWNTFILKTNIDGGSGYVANKEIASLIGESGVSISDLRPAGIGLFNDKRVDIVTEGEYIERGTSIVIIKEEGAKVIVKKNIK